MKRREFREAASFSPFSTTTGSPISFAIFYSQILIKIHEILYGGSSRRVDNVCKRYRSNRCSESRERKQPVADLLLRRHAPQLTCGVIFGQSNRYIFPKFIPTEAVYYRLPRSCFGSMIGGLLACQSYVVRWRETTAVSSLCCCCNFEGSFRMIQPLDFFKLHTSGNLTLRATQLVFQIVDPKSFGLSNLCRNLTPNCCQILMSAAAAASTALFQPSYQPTLFIVHDRGAAWHSLRLSRLSLHKHQDH